MAKIDPRRRLQEIDRRSRKRQQDLSLWGLVRSLHSAPAVREFITLESRPLKPLVVPESGGELPAARVYLPIALPSGDGYEAPWGVITWAWPSRRVVSMQDIRHRLGKARPSLTAEHLCDSQFAATIEAALAAGEPPPEPPEPLADLVRRGLGIVAPTAQDTPIIATEPPPPEPDRAQATVADLTSTFEAVHVLLREHGSATLERQWQRLNGRLTSSTFTVLVAGDLARGKSCFINSLLDQELLPHISSLSGVPVRIARCRQPMLEVSDDEGRRRQLELKDEAWQSIDPPESQGARPKAIRVGLPHPWLQEARLQLIELSTSGIDGQESSSQTLDILARADAAVVVVNAKMALSMSECAFIEQQLVARRVPRLAVVLTHLDHVRSRERPEALDFVRQKIATWNPRIQLGLAREVEGLAAGQTHHLLVGAEAWRQLIESWATDPEHRRRIHRQLSSGLLELLTLLRASLEERNQVLDLARDERRRRADQARQRLEQLELGWQDLRLELEERHRATAAWLTTEVGQGRQDIVERRRFELGRTSDPKLWRERDLPYQLGQDLAAFGRKLQVLAERRLAADHRWLLSEMQRRFTRQADSGPPTGIVMTLDGTLPADAGTDLIDLQRIRWWTRGGSLAVAATSYFFLPLGIVLSGATLLLGEIFLRQRVDRQRQDLEQSIVAAIDEAIDQALGVAQQHLRQLYAELGRSIQSQQDSWLQVHLEALEPVDSKNAKSEHGELVERLAVIDRLAGTLKSGGKDHVD